MGGEFRVQVRRGDVRLESRGGGDVSGNASSSQGGRRWRKDGLDVIASSLGGTLRRGRRTDRPHRRQYRQSTSTSAVQLAILQ